MRKRATWMLCIAGQFTAGIVWSATSLYFGSPGNTPTMSRRRSSYVMEEDWKWEAQLILIALVGGVGGQGEL